MESLTGFVGHPQLKRCQVALPGSRMSAVAFYWCLSARPPFSKVDLGQPCRLWRESFPPINEWLMFGVLCKVNYWLSWCLFVHGGMAGVSLSCPHSPPLQSLCLHLSQHDMVWKLPVCLLMMINVHSHVSNLGSLEESQRRLPRATCGGSWSAEVCASPAWIRCLLNFSIFPPATLGTLLGSLAQRAELEQMGGPPSGKLNLPSWSLLVRASLWGAGEGHSSFPLPPGPQIREPNEELNFLHSRCLSSIWR